MPPIPAINLLAQGWASAYMVLLLGIVLRYRLAKADHRHALSLLD